MNKAKKSKEVSFLSDQFSLAKAIFLVSFKGMNVEQMTNLRKALHPFNARIKVVRNTLARLAAKEHPVIEEALNKQLTKDNACIFVYDEVGGPAKFLKDFSEDIKSLQLKAGVLEGQALDKAKIFYLANLPSKKDLQALFLRVLQAPAEKFVRQLSTPASQLLRVLVAYRDSK